MRRSGLRAHDPPDVSGERRMLRMLLDLSVEDYRRGCLDASAWFHAPSTDDETAELLTFSLLCAWLALDADYVRRLLPRARPSRTRRRMTVGQDRRRDGGEE